MLCYQLPMRICCTLLIVACLWLSLGQASFVAAGAERETAAIRAHSPYAKTVDSLLRAATESDLAYRRLSELCDRFGPRFSGTTNLEAAIDWTLATLKEDGFKNVHGEDVMVPHWVRGNESVELLSPQRRSLEMLGLGGSVGTPADGITAEVMVVKTFEELKQHSTEARGRIVLFNAPYTDYHETVLFRTQGAIEAARFGAVASLVRSVTPFSLQTPHTGNMAYDDSVTRIPHAALTIEDADLLQRIQDRGEHPTVRLRMEAKTLPEANSRNVIAEIVGREKPEEIVILSGHIDSWDVGTGAQDDGGGCLAAWEAARLILKSGLQPRRTIRVVFWTNEENGLAGAKTYAKVHRDELAKHILAIESDAGTFAPTGFGFTGSSKAAPEIQQTAALLTTIGANKVAPGCRSADVMQLLSGGVPAMHLEVERPRYFWFHHTRADTIDKVDAHDLQRCAASMAAMAYVIADMPETLPR